MIIEFTLENFRSIREPQTLSLLATKSKELPHNYFQSPDAKYKLLKSSVIYGANASGKSNVIRALIHFIFFIYQSSTKRRNEPLLYYEPFIFNPNSSNEPTKFSIEFFSSDKIRYHYLVSFNNLEILEEKLVFYPNKQEANLFHRKKGRAIHFGDSLAGKKKIIEDLLLPNQLFLSKAANSNQEQLLEIYQYLSSMYISTTSFTPPIYNEFEESVNFKRSFEYFLLDDEKKSFLIKMLKSADIAIQDVFVKDESIEDYLLKNEKDRENVLKNVLQKMVSKHHINGEEYGLNFMYQESNGTIKMFSLASYLMNSLIEGKVLIIDEINSHLHPFISEYIVSLFHNPEINNKNAQLIFTTHDITLLDPKLMRRDQIWFTEKNKNQETELYSLSEFDSSKVKKETPFDKWYMSGRFGAVPLIQNNLFVSDYAKTKEKTNS